MTSAIRRTRLAVGLMTFLCATTALADTTPQTLPFSQDWSNAALLTVNNDWSGVPGIVGHRGDGLASSGADPQTVLAPDDTAPVLNVLVNQTTFGTSGGLAEFAITDPVVGMQGSGTADAPYLKIHLDTTDESDIQVSYAVRDLDFNADDTTQRVALQYRVGGTGDFINIPAAYVADATEPNAATKVTQVSVTLPPAAEDQPLVELRIMTADATGSDEWVGIDDIEITGSGEPPALALSVADASAAEGDSGASTMEFIISLNGPAPAGGVTFDIETSDGTATAGVDYNASAGGGNISEGQSVVVHYVTFHGDTLPEPNETFTVTLSNIVGAVAGDVTATGTILNDDALAPRDIQGDGALSPFDGQSVTVRGIVTAIRYNGFNIQSAVADANADTSEGVFVFTNTDHPLLTSLARGDDITLTATVDEYTPSARPHQRPLTELTGPTGVITHSTGNPLPAPVAITAGATDVDEFEKYEGMRVALGPLTAVSPVEGGIDENDAIGTSYGRFHGVLGDDARPFREEGLSVLDITALPGGVDTPDFDNNPERIRIVNDQEGAAALALDVGAVLTGIVGVMDYDYAIYSVLPDPDADIDVDTSATAVPTTVSDRAEGDVTIAGFNMLHFYDEVDDSGGDVALTPVALAIRLEKAARAICGSLKTPDIIGVVEVENLRVLQMIATAVNDDTFGVCATDPEYVAYLEPGNDVSNINVGFLVSTAEIEENVPRVDVQSVTQIGKTETFTNPSESTSTLFDRPPLVLDAVINNVDGSTYPVTVIANHLLSLTSVSSLAAGSNGWPTTGARGRAKRGFQAARTAEIVHEMQVADPDRHIVLLGDFNAFEFNDGYVDVMGVVTGREAAAEEVIWYVDSPLATPLTNMTTLVDAEHRYSYSFDGNAQVLDHMVVNQALLDDVPGVRTEHPRINADFGIDHYGDASLPTRISDHDPVLLVIPLEVDPSADLSVEVSADTASADASQTVSFSVDLANAGPMTASAVVIDIYTNSGVSVFDVTAPDGFSCTVQSLGDVRCSAASFPVGAVQFRVDAKAATYQSGTISTYGVLHSTGTPDPDSGDQLDNATTYLTVAATDLAVERVPPVSYLVLGDEVVATFAVRNVSGVSAYSPRLNVHINAPGATVVPTAPAGWTCGSVIPTGPVDPRVVFWRCGFDGEYVAGSDDEITFTIAPPTSMPVSLRASTFTLNPDSNPVNNAATAAFTVILVP